MAYLKIILATLLLQIAAAQQSQFSSIEGRVTSSNGEVLSKVTVTLLGTALAATPAATSIATPAAPPITAVTDTDGKFIFENLKPGTYRLRAVRQGFVGREYGQKGPNGAGVPVLVSPGQKLKDMTIALTPQGAITGRIVDRNGMPEIRALVQAWMPVYMGPLQGRTLTAIQTTTTDDQGNYRLFWLPPGGYFITASPEGTYTVLISSTATQTFISTTSLGLLNNAVRMSGPPRSDGTRDEESRITTYYPGVVNVKEATPVVVRAGATAAGIDIGIASVPVHRIRGVTVNGNTGNPESMQMQLSSASGSGARSLFRNSSDAGVFEIGGVLPGSYFLMAQASGLIAIVPVNVGNEDVNNVIVNVQARAFSISGRVSVEGIVANGAEQIPGLRIRLTSAQNSPFPTPQVELRGHEFTVRTVVPGDYQVVIEGSSNLYAKSVRLGNQDGLDILHLQSQPESPLEIVLSSSKGGIDGRVINDRREPVSGATVVLVPDPPFRKRTALYLTPSIDASGKFHIDAAPGFYKVFAWEDVELGIWMDPDFMFANETRGRPIVVSEGRNESIEVPVIPYVP